LTFAGVICIFHIGDKSYKSYEEKMEIILASDALSITKVKVKIVNPTRQNVISDIIKRAAKRGDTSVMIPDYVIYDRFDDSVGEKIVKEIKDAGYSISSSLVMTRDKSEGLILYWAVPEKNDSEDDYITKQDMEDAFS
jgi:hypothetical protein